MWSLHILSSRSSNCYKPSTMRSAPGAPTCISLSKLVAAATNLRASVALTEVENPATLALLSQLRHRGFACLTVDERETAQNLRLALTEARRIQGFRFPPMEEGALISYSENQRRIFGALFHIATICLGALMSQTPPHFRSEHPLIETLEQTYKYKQNRPFIHHSHEPFQPGQPFAGTFFNLFNYRHGMLNPHVDRSLLTVVYSSDAPALEPQQQQQQRSKLWIENRFGTWIDGDSACCNDDQVIIMIGEELQQVGVADALDLVPVLHAVKVDPKGPHVARPHYRPDPDQTNDSDQIRQSAALILRHDP